MSQLFFISSVEIKKLKFLIIIRDSKVDDSVFAIQLKNLMLTLLIKSCFCSSDLTSTHAPFCLSVCAFYVNLIIFILVDISFDVN